TRHDLGTAVVIGFVGSLKPWHGVDLLLEAFADLLQHPMTDRRNGENLTPLLASPDAGHANRTIPNRSRSHRTGASGQGQADRSLRVPTSPYGPDGFAPGDKQLRLLIVGDGPQAETLRLRAMAPDLAGTVIFTGPVPHTQIGAYLAAMDIAVA